MVLVVDDDPDLRAAVRDVLTDRGYVVVEAGTGAEARRILAERPPDAILLDLGLPDIGGLDLLMELAAIGSIPVLVLSSRSGETDRVIGLDLGADDYIVKPFSARELVARVGSAIRRQRRSGRDNLVRRGPLAIDLDTRDVWVDGRLVALTPREFDILAFLARSPRQVFSRHQILGAVWPGDTWGDDTSVSEHMHRIRRKLGPGGDGRRPYIETVRGMGYRFGGGD